MKSIDTDKRGVMHSVGTFKHFKHYIGNYKIIKSDTYLLYYNNML